MFQLHQRSPILFLVFKRPLKLSYIVKLPSGTAMPFVCLRELSVLSNHRGNEFLQPWLRTQFTATRVSVVILATNPPLLSMVAKQGGVSC